MKSESLSEYINYHLKSAEIGDIDPQNWVLKYLCDRFELNLEQRYWIAFLFGTCYCAPTVYYIYNEFPDFETVDVGRLRRWWDSNKKKCLFQTDRLKIQTMDKFVQTFISYKTLIGRGSQAAYFSKLNLDPKSNYVEVWRRSSKIKNFGRFSLFIYIELLYELCGLNVYPNELDIKNAESCKNGLLMAMGKDHLIGEKLNDLAYMTLEKNFLKVNSLISKENKNPKIKVTPWSVETSLCAFKKHKLGKRWVGYYLDRMAEEIKKLEVRIPDGVCWKPIWEMRKETYNPKHLTELTGVKSSLKEPYEGSCFNW